MNSSKTLCSVLLGTLLAPVCFGAADDDVQVLFDGTSLDGWQATDPTYWSVEEGAITGRDTERRRLGA